MTELLKEKLRIIASDDLSIQAIITLLYRNIEREKPKIVEGDNNTLLGEKYRAYEDARKMIGNFIMELKGYKITFKKTDELNKER